MKKIEQKSIVARIEGPISVTNSRSQPATNIESLPGWPRELGSSMSLAKTLVS